MSFSPVRQAASQTRSDASAPYHVCVDATWTAHVGFGPRLCENRFVSCQGEIPRNWFRRFVWEPETSEAPIGHQKSPLSLNGLQQGSAAQNRYNTLHVVGEHIECHLGCDLVSSSHQEVRRTHPSLYGPERMLCRLTTQGHLVGVLIEPLLNLLSTSSCSQRGMRRSGPVVH